MTNPDLAQQRLRNQRLAAGRLDNPCDAVAWLGAVQAQDYAAAKWAIGQRTTHGTDAAIEQLFAEGAILRTHLLRPTWHFVAPADIRWLLALTAPQVKAAMSYNNRRLELDDAVFARSNAALAEALQGKQLLRSDLAPVLQQAGIATDGLRLSHLVMRAELDGILCSGPRRGKQFTYALLEERVPRAPSMDREEALAALTERYFISRGPATLKDYAWWSGLSAADARAGLAMVADHLQHEAIDAQTYWSAQSLQPAPADGWDDVYLLPNYDEFIVGYTDRSASLDASEVVAPDARGNVLFNNTIVSGGEVVGTWKRTSTKDAVLVAATLFRPLTDATRGRLAAAAHRYGQFLGMPALLS